MAVPLIIGTVARFLLWFLAGYQLYQTYQALIDVVPGVQPGEPGYDPDTDDNEGWDGGGGALGFGIFAAVILFVIVAKRRKGAGS